jgi:hypothetical protein
MWSKRVIGVADRAGLEPGPKTYLLRNPNEAAMVGKDFLP